MLLFRWALVSGLIIVFCVAVLQMLMWTAVLRNPNDSHVMPLDAGEQEIALIEPATSTDDWGRLITALQFLEKQWPDVNPNLPRLSVSLDNAFPPLTAAVPEIVF